MLDIRKIVTILASAGELEMLIMVFLNAQVHQKNFFFLGFPAIKKKISMLRREKEKFFLCAD